MLELTFTERLRHQCETAILRVKTIYQQKYYSDRSEEYRLGPPG